jgi:hypothetical protein
MNRDYPEWDMSAGTRSRIDAQVREQIYRGVPPGEDSGASEQQIGREELTRRLAGTGDKSSRAWKTARDTLTRYRNGRRRVGSKNATRIRKATEAARRDRMHAARTARVQISAGWQTSRTLWLGKAVADLSGPDLYDFLDAIEAGNTLLAIQIVADVYGLDPEFVMSLEEIGEITITSEGIDLGSQHRSGRGALGGSGDDADGGNNVDG